MTELILYHCPQTRAGTTLWMNEELGAPCEVKLINVLAGEQKTPEFLAVNPMGKVPALIDEGHVVTEAAAICAHLADRFPDAGLAPLPGDPARGTYLRWMFFAPSCIEPMMLDKLGNTPRTNSSSVGYGGEDSVLGALTGLLTDRDYVLGDQFSAVDVVLGSTLNFATMFGAIEKVEPFASYLDRLMGRPAVQKANEKNEAFLAQLAKE